MSFGGMNEVLRATYVLDVQDRGLAAATTADRQLRDSTKRTAEQINRNADAVQRLSRRQQDAWSRAATVAVESNRKIVDAHAQATRKIDSAITGTVKRMREMGVGYDEISRYMKAYRADANQTALAIERSAKKEVDAIDRTRAAWDRLHSVRERAMKTVGLGPGAAPIHPFSAAGGFAARAGGAARSALSGGAGFLVGGLAGYLGVSSIRAAAGETASLVKQASILSHYTGMSQQQALQFQAVAEALGVSTRSLGMTFRTLGQQVNTALTHPTEASTRAFRELGISHQEVAANAHNLQGLLGLVADRLNKIPAGAERTALASRLLGRNWQQMAPLIMGGSKAMDEQLNSAKALGVELGGNSTQNMLKLHEASIQLRLAQVGLEVQFTQHILPALIKVAMFGLKLYEVIRTNLAPVFHFLGGAIHSASGFLREHTTLLKAVGVAVTGLVSAYAALKIISTVTRLVRGVGQDFRTFFDIVKTGGKALFAQQSEQDALMASNAKLAESNIRLAQTFEAVAVGARGAAGAEALAGEAGAMGGGGLSPLLQKGRAAAAAERGAVGAESALASEAGLVGRGAATEAASGGILGSLLGRGPLASITNSVKGLAARAGLGGIFLGGAGATAAASGVERAAASAGATAVEKAGGGILSKVGGLAGGAMGALGIAGMGMMGAQLGGQLIGGIAGRGVGSAVSSIGTGASIGAGIGSIVPGVGTLLGGGIGAGIGALQHFGVFSAIGGLLGLGPSKQQQDASKLLADMQHRITNASRDTLQNLQRRYTYQLHEGGLTRQQADAVQRGLTQRGLQVAMPAIQGTMATIATSRYAPHAGAIAAATEADLRKLPGQAQRIGAEAMIQFSAGMEANHKLPVGTTDRLIAQLQDRYGPKLASRLMADGRNSMAVMADTIQNSKVLSTVQAQVDSIHRKWALVAPDAKVSADNFMQVVTADMTSLEGVIRTSTGKQHDDAVASYKALRVDAGHELDQMVKDTIDKQASITAAIQSGSAQAASTAASNFQALQQNVYAAMSAGVVSTEKGSKMISDALNKTLKAYGAKPVPVNVTVAALQQQAATGAISGQVAAQGIRGASFVPGGASGLRVPGPPGPDNWMLLDPSGSPAAMVSGSEILVTNRHTEARVDQMLSVFGTSLGAEVGAETRPNGYAYGGYIDPIAGFTLGRTDMGVDANAPVGTAIRALGRSKMVGYIPNWYQGQPLMNFQLLSGPDAGRFWYVAEEIVPRVHMGQVIPQGGVVATYAPTGTGIEIGWAGNAAGATLAQMTSGYSEGQATSAGASFKRLVEGGAPGILGGAIPQIGTPRVGGTGTVHTLASRAVGKMAHAANAYLASTIGGVVGGMPHLGHGSTASKIAAFFRSRGLSPTAIAGIEGNWMQESGLNPAAPGGGLAQWIGSRGAALSALAAREGVSPASLAVQLQFAWQELSGPYRGALSAIERAKSPEAAAQAFSNLYEMPGIPMMGNRMNYARQALGQGYALGGRIPGFQTGGSTNLGLGWVTAPTSSSSHRSHRAETPHYHLDPFTGTYKLMTASAYSALKDAYIRQYGHPYHAPTHHRPRKPATPHIHWDPFTNSYKMLTSAQYQSQIIGPYFSRFHKPPPTRPAHAKTHRLPYTVRQEQTAIQAGTAQGLFSGFDLGYQFGLDPTQSGATDPLGALNAALAGISAAGTRGYSGLLPGFEALYGRAYNVRRIPRPTGGPPVIGSGSNALPVGARGIRLRLAGSHRPPTHRVSLPGGLHVHVPGIHDTAGGGYVGLEDWATATGLGLGSTQYAPETNIEQILGETAPATRSYVAGIVGMHSAFGMIRHRVAPQITRLTRGGSQKKLEEAMKHIARDVEDVGDLSYTGLERIHRALVREMKKVPPHSAAEKRLQNALQMTDYAMGQRVGRLVAQAEGQATALQAGATRLQRLMQREGIAATSGTGAGMLEKFDNQAVVSLKGTVKMLQNALGKAEKAKDKSAVQDISSKLTAALDQLDQAVTDAVQAHRDAVEAAAQDAVTAATHTTTMATSSEQALSTLQQIAAAGGSTAADAKALGLGGLGAIAASGTAGGALQMSSYITKTVVPALQGELSALQKQQAAAKSVGDTTLASQIAEAIAAKQNEVEQAKLDALNAIKDATQATAQDLSQLSGATGFDFNNQPFTDAIAAMVGA